MGTQYMLADDAKYKVKTVNFTERSSFQQIIT